METIEICGVKFPKNAVMISYKSIDYPQKWDFLNEAIIEFEDIDSKNQRVYFSYTNTLGEKSSCWFYFNELFGEVELISLERYKKIRVFT